MPLARAPSTLAVVRASDDLALARACARGEPQATRALFHRERRRVHATLYRVLGSNLSMDDLVQDVFLEVFRGVGSFRGDASLSTWVDRCTVHVALTHLRRKRPHAVELPVDAPSRAPSPEHQTLMREATRRLYAELDAMEPTLRLALTLAVIDERPIAEVARMMGSSEVATRVRVWRARRHLEACAAKDASLGVFLRGDAALATEAE